VKTRPATLADLDSLMLLERTIFPEDAWSTDGMLQELSSPHGHYLVVERNAEIVAYAGAHHLPGDDVADIQTIAVAESARGNGVGAGLFDELILWCRGRGAKRILLDVRSDNLVAQKLYQSRGFDAIAVREGYYQPAHVDALVMERRLTS